MRLRAHFFGRLSGYAPELTPPQGAVLLLHHSRHAVRARHDYTDEVIARQLLLCGPAYGEPGDDSCGRATVGLPDRYSHDYGPHDGPPTPAYLHFHKWRISGQLFVLKECRDMQSRHLTSFCVSPQRKSYCAISSGMIYRKNTLHFLSAPADSTFCIYLCRMSHR